MCLTPGFLRDQFSFSPEAPQTLTQRLGGVWPARQQITGLGVKLKPLLSSGESGDVLAMPKAFSGSKEAPFPRRVCCKKDEAPLRPLFPARQAWISRTLKGAVSTIQAEDFQ